MKIQIVLNGQGGELDRQIIDVADDDSAEISEHIHEAMNAWILDPPAIVSQSTRCNHDTLKLILEVAG